MSDDDSEDFETLFNKPLVDIDAELLLWTQVRSQVEPLKTRERVRNDEAPKRIEMRSLMDDYAYDADMVESADGLQSVQGDIERRINKGRIPIDVNIDLHDMPRKDAHRYLYQSLHHAYNDKKRTALVVTGKGKAGEGVLKQALPRWLASAQFANIVSSYAPAAIQHGGTGAFYVRLRK